MVLTVIAAACAVLALAGAAYFAITLSAALRFAGEPVSEKPQHFTPAVSILRSVKGLDPKMELAFRSHCNLDYDQYEVLYGVSDLDDPALALVEKVQREFPNCRIRVVHCPQSLGMNGKVSNLIQMLPQARYEHVIMNDSDVVVPRDYLQRVLAPFAEARVGMVTTLYRAIAGNTLPSRIESLGISSDFMGGVLVARALEGGIRFGLGATMATTKAAVREIGGLEPLVDCLADDYELGARIAAAGRKVELAHVVVETALHDYTWREFWAHQLRWARTVKDRRPAPYLGLVVTFGLVWAVLGVLAAPYAWWTWAALGLTAVARIAAAVVLGKAVLHDERMLRDLWLVPVRDFIALAVWVASFAGNQVEWRGQRFRLRDGKLEKI